MSKTTLHCIAGDAVDQPAEPIRLAGMVVSLAPRICCYALLRAIDPEVWGQRENPFVVIQHFEPQRLLELNESQ